MKSIHYSVVTWTSWRLKSPAARIVQVLQQNSKALHNCSSERGIHHWSGDSHHKGPVMLFSVCMSWRQMLMYYLCCSSHSMCVVPCVKFNNDELIYSTYGYFLYFYIGACVHFGKWILTKTILFLPQVRIFRNRSQDPSRGCIPNEFLKKLKPRKKSKPVLTRPIMPPVGKATIKTLGPEQRWLFIAKKRERVGTNPQNESSHFDLFSFECDWQPWALVQVVSFRSGFSQCDISSV